MTQLSSKNATPDSSPLARHPLSKLPVEDLDLIAELVLQSASLKGLAASYGVSYPTIRTRFDKVIERTRDAVAGRTPDPVSELLASLVEQGELSPSGARALREVIRRADHPHGANA